MFIYLLIIIVCVHSVLDNLRRILVCDFVYVMEIEPSNRLVWYQREEKDVQKRIAADCNCMCMCSTSVKVRGKLRALVISICL